MVFVLQPSQRVSRPRRVARSIDQIRRRGASEEVTAAIYQEAEIWRLTKIIGIGNFKGIRDGINLVVQVAPSVRNKNRVAAEDLIFRATSILRAGKNSQATYSATKCNSYRNTTHF